MGLESQGASEWPEEEIRALQDALWKRALGGRDGQTSHLKLHEMRYGQCHTGGQTSDERFAAAILLASVTGSRLNEASALLHHVPSELASSYFRITRNKTNVAVRDGRQSAADELQPWLSQTIFEGEPVIGVENPYLSPVVVHQSQGPLESWALTRVYADIGRTDALLAHLSSLDAQLTKN